MEWWVAARPMPGEQVNGDNYVALSRDGFTLLAVIDGLGHGIEAAQAADKAAAAIEAHADLPLDEIVRSCHGSLRRSRGVVLAIASIEHGQGRMTWLAVGNVDGRVYRAPFNPGEKEAVLQRSGVVGYQLPRLEVRTVSIGPGDIVVMATDGIESGYGESLWTGAIEAAPERLLAAHARPNDDALIMLARIRSQES